jgi:hypothetical protein
MSVNVWQWAERLTVIDNVWRRLESFNNVRKCLTVIGTGWQCQPVPENVWQYWQFQQPHIVSDDIVSDSDWQCLTGVWQWQRLGTIKSVLTMSTMTVSWPCQQCLKMSEQPVSENMTMSSVSEWQCVAVTKLSHIFLSVVLKFGRLPQHESRYRHTSEGNVLLLCFNVYDGDWGSLRIGYWGDYLNLRGTW